MKLFFLLFPLSWLYGIVVRIRIFLYEHNFLKSKKFDIPILCVGNITVGGTGKTPHIEYLIRLLSPHFSMAVLSRGYKRKMKGFVEVGRQHTAQEVGDEPLQIKRKFPFVPVVVDKDRRNGVERILKLHPEVNLILMDDGFQHLKIRARVNIVLLDYHRLPINDHLLPAGRLREPFEKGKERANLFIITKVPISTEESGKKQWIQSLHLPNPSKVFFSSLNYMGLQSFESFARSIPQICPLEMLNEVESVLLFTGIATFSPLIDCLKTYPCFIQHLAFSDHHSYSIQDIQTIENQFLRLDGKKKILLTTEKDAVRLLNFPHLSQTIMSNLYLLPIEISLQPQPAFKKILYELIEKRT